MTKEVFLDNVYAAIEGGFAPDDATGSMTAAKIGLILRQRGIIPELAGYLKLKDLLADLERRGLIRTGTNSKYAFALWLTNGGRTMQRPLAVPTSRLNAPPFRRLRQPVWHAFVAEAPEGSRFLNRHTGEVRLAQQQTPDPPEDWLAVDAINPTREKEEARRFLASHGVEMTDAIDRAMESSIWYAELPRALDQTLALQWKRHRSGRVVEHVEEWRQRHRLEHRLIYDDERESQSTGREHSNLRQALLAAIGAMSTEELLALPIPARNLVSELRPDLIRR